MSVPIDDEAITALQGALAAEHAALWSYTLILAFVPGDQAVEARQDITAHRTLRSQVEQTLTDVGARPVSAQPAYATPVPVTDALSAGKLAVTAEADALAAWRSVLEHTTNQQLRVAALTALSEGTVRASRWRAATGTAPVIPSLPGIVR
ncbi:ferritin-like domain-containing protein [Pseudonocardia sp. RS11V-5]|uniref:ferritin-like domain-containing protein n=1 Tax=Pseudonocardia terrae TaxID=2905831 RepID=UPI001E35A05A|nr:ferritin-like domain-containing protein [Pseudonocardia terrae]MCE3555040.1 ferritin-like domain-containing protein [Pseudonocardia terrae]